MQIDFDELMYFVFEIAGLILHIKSSPIDPLNIFEPFVANKLIPHGQADSRPRIGLENA